MITSANHAPRPPDEVVDPYQALLSSVAPVAVVSDFVGVGLDDYDRLIRALHLPERGSALPGCLFHWVRSTADGVRICEVWRNQALFDLSQRDEAQPAYRRLRFPEPELTVYPIHNYLTSADLID